VSSNIPLRRRRAKGRSEETESIWLLGESGGPRKGIEEEKKVKITCSWKDRPEKKKTASGKAKRERQPLGFVETMEGRRKKKTIK